MALNEKDLSEMLGRFIPDDMTGDPHISYRPPETRVGKTSIPATAVRPTGLSQTKILLPKWKIERDLSATAELKLDADIPPDTAYALRCVVGEGGFGEVWQAVQTALGRVVAVKRMREDLIKLQQNKPENIEQMEDDFRREALTTALLEHPNIVPVHDLGVDEHGRPLLAMKMVRGKGWDEMMTADKELPVPDFLARHLPIFIDVAQAVAFAHSCGIVHRDLKPSQVMVGEFGEVLLMDWGIAVLFDSTKISGKFHTIAGDLAPTPENAFNPTGTPAFMAPEQTKNTSEEIGPWTDTYLLGGILYFILTGKAPHAGREAMDSFLLAMRGTVKPPEEAAPDREIPKDLAEIAMAAMAPEKEKRFQTVKDIILLVEDYLSGSGKRRESIALVKQVEKRIEDAGENYKELTECNNLLMQALALWPQNNTARNVQDLVMHKFARAAIRNNDLVLANLMTESMHPSEERTNLHKEIQDSHNRNTAHLRQLRVLKILSVVFVIAIVIDIIFVFGWGRSSQNKQDTKVASLNQKIAATEEKLQNLEAQFSSDTLPKLAERLALLRSRENALGQRLGAMIPLPRQINWSENERRSLLAKRQLIESLLAEHGELQAEREALAEQIGNGVGNEPLSLPLAELNWQLATRLDSTQYLELADEYRRLGNRYRDRPEPFIGAGIAVARSGDAEEAREYFTIAAKIIDEQPGELDAFIAVMVNLHEELSQIAPKQPDSSTSDAKEASGNP